MAGLMGALGALGCAGESGTSSKASGSSTSVISTNPSCGLEVFGFLLSLVSDTGAATALGLENTSTAAPAPPGGLLKISEEVDNTEIPLISLLFEKATRPGMDEGCELEGTSDAGDEKSLFWVLPGRDASESPAVVVVGGLEKTADADPFVAEFMRLPDDGD
jgi:hypothetical protein